MKTKKLMTTAVALMLSVGVVSCASDKEKQEEQRQEETRELEQQQQEAEEEARQAESELESMRQEQEDTMAHSEDSQASQSDKPWADQQVSLDKVEKVQEKLKSEGYEVGSVDGLIGPNTSSALEKFQSDKGLNANGELTQETIDEMGLDIQIDSQAEFAE